MSLQNTKFNTNLDSRLAAYAALAGIALTGAAATTAEAVVVYSGIQNINVPSNIDGIYLNLVTGQSGTAGFAGYDVNPYNNNAGLAFFAPGGSQGTLSATATSGSTTIRLNMGDSIGPAGAYNNGQSVASAFYGGGQAYVGVRFTNEATGLLTYGWLLMNTSSGNGFPATIVSWGYQTDGTAITAGEGAPIPEPTTTALLGLMAVGALGIRQWRRRKAA